MLSLVPYWGFRVEGAFFAPIVLGRLWSSAVGSRVLGLSGLGFRVLGFVGF